MYKNTARAALIIIATLSIVAAFLLPRVTFDYDFESFFPIDDPDLAFYKDYREKFYPDNEFVLIALEKQDGIFDTDFLSKVDSLTDDLKKTNLVERVQSPTSISQVVMGPFGPINVPYLHPDEPEKYSSDSTRIYRSEHLIGSFFSEDAKSVSISLQAEPYLSKDQSDSLVTDIDNAVAQYDFEDVHIAGRIHGQKYYIQKMKEETALFISAGIVLLIIFLIISFRSFWGVWVPLSVVLLSVIWVVALMVLTDKPLDIMAVLLPTILFVVGVSDVVHIITRYLEELRLGKTKIEALKVAFKQVGLATFLTSLTTAVGFLTLLTANIQPIRDFGVYTAIGVFIAFILAFTLLPSILILRKKPTLPSTLKSNFWRKYMHMAFGWMLSHQKLIVGLSAVVLVLAGVGISQMRVDNYLLEDLAEDDPHRQDFEFFEKHYSGVRPFEMALFVTDSSKTVFDYEAVQEFQKVENYLKDQYDIGFSFSPLTYVKMANQALNGGNPDAYMVPTEKEYTRVKQLIDKFKDREQFNYFVTEDLKEARFSGKIRDLGGHVLLQKNAEMREELPAKIDTSVVDFRLTGMGLLVDKSNKTLASNMLYGLLIAFGVIALIMGVLFRSVPVIIATLIPNVMPLLIIAGIMGFADIDLKVTTSIIFTIAFGIAVDDTIHYMSKVNLELRNEKSILYALKSASITTGKAITVTSLILISGFISLILSTFASTYYVGLLVSITLLFAVIADLFLLPVLLMIVYKWKKKK